MAVLARDISRSRLPARIRVKSAPDDSIASRLALADRIAQLPGIETVEDRWDSTLRSVDVFLRRQPVSLRKQWPPTRLCSISVKGISVYGLSDPDRHQVLSRGWGRLAQDGVLMFLPRDEAELDVCWDVLQRAYHSLIQASAQTAPVRTIVWGGNLPRFSRTTLQ